MHGAHQVNVGHQTKVLDGSFRKTLVPQNPRVVDENIDPAPAIHRLGHHVFDLRQVGHVGAMRHRLATKRFNFSHHIEGGLGVRTFARYRAAQIVHHHLRTALGELNSVAAPKTTAGAGHQCHFSVVTNCHLLSPES